VVAALRSLSHDPHTSEHLSWGNMPPTFHCIIPAADNRIARHPAFHIRPRHRRPRPSPQTSHLRGTAKLSVFFSSHKILPHTLPPIPRSRASPPLNGPLTVCAALIVSSIDEHIIDVINFIRTNHGSSPLSMPVSFMHATRYPLFFYASANTAISVL
jgi:hypothetical protein